MTRYAVDPSRQQLVRILSTPGGEAVSDVWHFDGIEDTDIHRQIATTMTALSRTLWHTYTDPASAALDDLSPNSEGWRREMEREEIGRVAHALRNPNLPMNGYLVQPYGGIEGSAQQLGCLLHEIGNPEFTDAISIEVDEEIRTIERAESGDLTDRAAQAILLSRASASPTQVAVAFALLQADPFGSRELREQVDPTSASVAAGQWLLAAARVAASLSGIGAESVVMEADNIEELSVATPTEVLARLIEGDDPYDVVSELIRIAMAVADGYAIAPAREPAKMPLYRTDFEGKTSLSYLDPRRPAPDLLEDLLGGIYGAYLLWAEYDESEAPDEDALDEEALEEEWESSRKQRQAIFVEQVRLFVQPG